MAQTDLHQGQCWRFLISRAAYRFTLNNNLQYVSNYDQPNNVESSNSFGILYEFEGSDIISSSKFYCITREYYNQGASANLFSYGNSNKKIKVTTVDKYASGTLQYFD